jgi:hypothetical protein
VQGKQPALVSKLLSHAPPWPPHGPNHQEIDGAREHDEPRDALDILHRAAQLVASVNRQRLALVVTDARQHGVPF